MARSHFVGTVLVTVSKCGLESQKDHPLLVGPLLTENYLSNVLLLIMEEIQMNNMVAIICSKMQILMQTFALIMLRKLVLQVQDRFSREILEGLSCHSAQLWRHI